MENQNTIKVGDKVVVVVGSDGSGTPPLKKGDICTVSEIHGANLCIEPYYGVDYCWSSGRFKKITPKAESKQPVKATIPKGVQFKYLRPSRGEAGSGGMTIAYRLKDNILELGIAYCNPKDAFSKVIGRNQAIEALEKRPVTFRFPALAAGLFGKDLYDSGCVRPMDVVNLMFYQTY